MKTGLYDKEGNELNLEQVMARLPLGGFNRFELINHLDPEDGHARAFIRYGKMDVSLSPQDNNRTLKVFISKK